MGEWEGDRGKERKTEKLKVQPPGIILARKKEKLGTWRHREERKWKKGYSETREREKGNVNRKTEGKGRIKQAEKKKSRGGGECK